MSFFFCRLLLESYDLQTPIEQNAKEKNRRSHIEEWFCSLLKKLHTLYPDVYQSIIKLSNVGANLTRKQKLTLNMLLSSEILSDTILSKSGYAIFDKLCHHDLHQRLDAIQYLSKNYFTLSTKDQEFLKSYLLELFKETDPRILEWVLQFPIKLLSELLGNDLFDTLLKLLRVIGANEDLINVLCSGAVKVDETKLFVELLPILCSDKVEEKEDRILQILNSKFGRQHRLLKGVKSAKGKIVAEHIFKNGSDTDLESVIKIVKDSLSKNNLIGIKYLKSILPKKCQIELSIEILEMLEEKKLKIEPCLELINDIILKTDLKFNTEFIDLTIENSNLKFVKLCFKFPIDSIKLLLKGDLKSQLTFVSSFYFAEFELQKKSLELTKSLFGETELSWLNKYENLIIPSLIVQLMDVNNEIRSEVLNILEIIYSHIKSQKGGYGYLVGSLLQRKHEIVLDHDQLPLIIYTIISPDTSVQKGLKNTSDKATSINTFQTLTKLATSDYPLYFLSAILKMMSQINSKQLLEQLSMLGIKLLDNTNLDYDKNQSDILINLILQFNLNNLDKLNEKSNIWKLIKLSLDRYKITVITDKGQAYFIDLLLDLFTKELFNVLSDPVKDQFIKLVINIGTESEIPDVRSAVFKIFKRIDLNTKFLVAIFSEMYQIQVTTGSELKKRKRPTNIPSVAILTTPQWKNGITALEFLQNKKKFTNPHLIIPSMFEVLKKCLDFEEQASLEYPKQLILSCLLNCCEKLSPAGVLYNNFSLIPQSGFNIELIVQCVRGTPNPQTHHHALLLLSHLAGMFPSEVLNHIMAIFTFMGSSVLRHDDAYSFQIITKIIDIVIPILINSNQDVELTERVVPVLRVFVAVLIDVPVHRRIPLYEKLLNTFDPKTSLWVFLVLVFESHILNATDIQTTQSKRLEIATTISLQFPPDIILHTCIELLKYLKDQPDKFEGHTDKIFSLDPNPKQFRHFKYTIVTFVAGLLSSSKLIHTIAMFNDDASQLMEPYYRNLIITVLSYIQVVSKFAERLSDLPQGKYWKVMLHHCFDILDYINSLLSTDMFLLVIRGLMSHNISIVRRKAMELLNSKLQSQIEFDAVDKSLFDILDALVEIISTIGVESEVEEELNQQTALYSIKLLSKKLANEHPDKFRPILDKLIHLLKSKNINQNVLASVVLSFAELTNNLRIHSLYSLNNFMPLITKLFSQQKSKTTPDLTFLSIVIAISKIIDTLPLFMSPYLPKLLTTTSILSAKWFNESNPKIDPINTKLKLINHKLATMIPHRVLVPAIGETHSKLLSGSQIPAVAYLMEILSESIKILEGAELKAVQNELTDFFIPALEFRSENTQLTLDEISQIEGHIIKAFNCLILKLSESNFRPLYYKLFDWATRNSEDKDRSITFYRVSRDIATCLKGLFVLFAGHFLKNSAALLDATNLTKTKSRYFEDDQKSITLITYILETLNLVFLYDTQNFVDKDRFELLMQPIVDQLENTIGGEMALRVRVESILVPCISNFAVACADDSLWKQLNYQILLKTRNNSSCVRLAGLKTLCEMAKKLGEDFLPLLPETIPFIAELMEDEDEEVETACRKAVQELEKVLGESLQKYF